MVALEGSLQKTRININEQRSYFRFSKSKLLRRLFARFFVLGDTSALLFFAPNSYFHVSWTTPRSSYWSCRRLAMTG